jgi:hypothetical protein
MKITRRQLRRIIHEQVSSDPYSPEDQHAAKKSLMVTNQIAPTIDELLKTTEYADEIRAHVLGLDQSMMIGLLNKNSSLQVGDSMPKEGDMYQFNTKEEANAFGQRLVQEWIAKYNPENIPPTLTYDSAGDRDNHVLLYVKMAYQKGD